MVESPLLESRVLGYSCRRGKVRDVYDLGDKLVIIASDRISAFDWVMPTGIPGKGRILTEMTRFWLDWLKLPNHFLSARLEDLPAAFQTQPALEGRTMLVRKTNVVPIECVARGYLVGSGWKEYQENGTVCGVSLPAGLKLADRLSEPIFTPATKAEEGHDENISFETMAKQIGSTLANTLREETLSVYCRANQFAEAKGLILADTKLEWGLTEDGTLLLIDEVLTPDSSRYWPASEYKPGNNPPSFDKQYLRDWLEQSGWDKNSPPPELPAEIVANTARKYQEALTRLLK